MKLFLILTALCTLSSPTFAYEASGKGALSISEEIFFSTAISSITSEISSFSASDLQKQEARKLQQEVQDYNQSGLVSNYLSEKIAVIHSLDNTLSLEEAVDVLIEVSEIILAK